MLPNQFIKSATVQGLLSAHAALLAELNGRGIIRSSNNPVGDYAEYLFTQVFGWRLAEKSAKGFDATDSVYRYQIKGRRVSDGNPSRQIGALRALDARNFDYLAGVVFDLNYSVLLAAIIPHSSIVTSKPTFSTHSNAHIFHLDDRIWKMDGVQDVTDDIRRFALSI